MLTDVFVEDEEHKTSTMQMSEVARKTETQVSIYLHFTYTMHHSKNNCYYYKLKVCTKPD